MLGKDYKKAILCKLISLDVIFNKFPIRINSLMTANSIEGNKQTNPWHRSFPRFKNSKYGSGNDNDEYFNTIDNV